MSILDEAIRTVGPTNRGADYGHPLDNFQMESELMNIWFKYKHGNKGKFLGPFDWQDMAIHKLFMKITRELNRHKRDNIVDIAGYAWCYEEAMIEAERRRNPDGE